MRHCSAELLNYVAKNYRRISHILPAQVHSCVHHDLRRVRLPDDILEALLQQRRGPQLLHLLPGTPLICLSNWQSKLPVARLDADAVLPPTVRQVISGGCSLANHIQLTLSTCCAAR